MNGHTSPASPAPVPSGPTSPGTEKNTLNTQEVQHGDQSGNAEAQKLPIDSENRTNNKGKLQDQTNLLPFKQLMIVFVGLSCALFCKSFSHLILLLAEVG